MYKKGDKSWGKNNEKIVDADQKLVCKELFFVNFPFFLVDFYAELEYLKFFFFWSAKFLFQNDLEKVPIIVALYL